jgi:hypothetical protein
MHANSSQAAEKERFVTACRRARLGNRFGISASQKQLLACAG